MAVPDEILDLFDGTDTDRCTTSEVATELRISKQATWVHRSNLRDEDWLEREPGNEVHEAVWSCTAGGRASNESAGDDS